MDPANIIATGGAVLFLLVLANLVMLLFTTARQTAAVSHQRRLDGALLSERLALARLQLKKQENVGSWNGTRKFKIDRIIEECTDVCSFYLVPHDKKPLPAFLPGQFLTFELDIPGQRNRVIRCYSLSDRPRPDYYRVTIKRVSAPAEKSGGKAVSASNHFHNALKAEDILDVKAPGGGFFLDTNRLTPVVLLAGGVGITPIVCMVNEIVESIPQREVWIMLSMRNGPEHIFKEHLERLAKANTRLHLHVSYSRPNQQDVLGRDYHHEGHLNLALLRKHLPSNNFDFYMCGPGAMMKDLDASLREWGVPEENIHLEAFGPASVTRPAPAAAGPGVAQFKVGFCRSNREMAWTGQVDSLLDLALAEGVPIGYGCRAGNCGSCKTAIKSGKVKYRKRPGCEVEAGSCLTCIAVPEGDLSLDA